MARPSGEKSRNSGNWTEARFNSFIKSMLRQGTRRWGPIQESLKKARVSRGYYLCNSCKEEVTATIKEDRKRVKNAIVDHIEPIIDPKTGFTTWDDCISRMFCEEDNLQVLCKECHDKKSMDERATSAEYRKKRKEQDDKSNL